MYVTYIVREEEGPITAKEALAVGVKRLEKEWTPDHYHIESIGQRGDGGWTVSFTGPDNFKIQGHD